MSAESTGHQLGRSPARRATTPSTKVRSGIRPSRPRGSSGATSSRPTHSSPLTGRSSSIPARIGPRARQLLKDGCKLDLSTDRRQGRVPVRPARSPPSLTTTVGTTVHYRITITNTGNVALTGVTLIDNHFDLAPSAARSRRPSPSAPTTTATTACRGGTTTNVATGDSARPTPTTGTATVVATPPPAPALTVDKGVCLSAAGPFAASLTTTIGTTVHYRITVTNTGNVTLHGVTLTDNKTNMTLHDPGRARPRRSFRLRLLDDRGRRRDHEHSDRPIATRPTRSRTPRRSRPTRSLLRRWPSRRACRPRPLARGWTTSRSRPGPRSSSRSRSPIPATPT